jgi:transposase
MEACEVVRLFVNKAAVPPEPRRRGNPGYGCLKAVRLLVYSRLGGLENDTRIVEHLKKHPEALRGLGFRHVPDRTTVGRWWRRYAGLLKQVFGWVSRLVRTVAPTTLLVVDSTPLVDLHDLEAEWGFTSRGPFKGFKLHAAVNQLGLPLRGTVTSGNRYDGSLLPSLLEDLEAEYVLADAGYDSKRNRDAVRAMGAEPIMVSNPRRAGIGRGLKHLEQGLLKAKRYLVEQFNGLIKNHVLKECWTKPRGLAKKTSMVTAALISLSITAVSALLEGGLSLKAVSRFWA